jgi:hypothetical protein
MTQLPEGISNWIRNREIGIELVLAALVALSAALKFLHLAGADEALMIAMLTLAAFYFLNGFLGQQETNIASISSKIFSVASSVCVIGLLFAFLRLPGAKEQLTIGLLSLAACTIVSVFLAITGKNQKFVPMLIRVVVLGGVSLNAWLGLSDPATSQFP